MCDFYTPQYFDPVSNPGVRYSFAGSVTQPKQILRGGYLSWINPEDNMIYQANFFGSEIKFKVVKEFHNVQGSLRSKIDLLTKNETKKELFKEYLEEHKTRLDRTKKTTLYTGKNIQDEIHKISQRKIKNKKS